MKNVLSLFLLLLVSAATFAQSSVKQTAHLREDQVPVAVRIAFQKDFGSVPDDGFWTVHVQRVLDGQQLVTIPKWYGFNKRTKGARVEVRYSPEGNLLSHKGIERLKSAPAEPGIS